MNVNVIVGHPHQDSFNHAIANAAVDSLRQNGHEVVFHDLYDEGFDPVLPHEEIPQDGRVYSVVQRYCEEIAVAEGIIIVHPNWWGQPPAILKGWVDRVLRPGIAYMFKERDSGEGIPVGLLRAKAALVFNTANTPEERESQVFGDPLERLWRDCIFSLCGVNTFFRKMFRVIVASTPQERRQWLEEVRHIINRYFPKEKE